MSNLLITRKLIAWATLPILPILGTFAWLWLYLAEDRPDYRNPYPF